MRDSRNVKLAGVRVRVPGIGANRVEAHGAPLRIQTYIYIYIYIERERDR